MTENNWLATKLLILYTLIATVAIAGVRLAMAADVPPLQAFQEAKANGMLPAWTDVSDRVRLIPKWPVNAYLCIEDRGSPKRFVIVGKTLSALIAWYDTGLVSVPTTWQPATVEDIRVCFPDYVPPVPPVPKALGEPVYAAIVHLPASTPPKWRSDAPLDWPTMNTAYIARTSTAGEACGTRLDVPTESSDPLVAWHVVKGGMTRCKLQ